MKSFFTLLAIQLKTFRILGLMTLIISCLLPFLIIVFMKLIFKNLPLNNFNLKQTYLYLLSGNVVLGISNLCIIMLSQTIAGMKEIKTFEYYATLPISKISFILAILFSFLIIAIPAFLFLLFAGGKILNLNFNFNFNIIILLILLALSFSGIGALLGITAKNNLQANILSQIAGFGILMISPVFFPLSVLPKTIQYLAMGLPTTYAAYGLRKVLILNSFYDKEVILCFFMLTFFTAISFILINSKIKFQQN